MSYPAPLPSTPTVAAPILPLDLLPGQWPAGEVIHRVYDANWGSREFYAGTVTRRGRFHPFTPDGATDPLPVLYGASDLAGALAETVFHDVPVRGLKTVTRGQLNHKIAVELIASRDLVLADLTGPGLHRIATNRAELLDGGPRTYPHTAPWAKAVHAAPTPVDGMIWVPRLNDRSRSILLFADRVAASELTVRPDSILKPLAVGEGFDHVADLADQMAILITDI
ncbi:RES family NAD+ phosphorylase [Nakamurella endophytica]|uniref:RES domain-containing protein n=1 Tax=Nakamurella endophytica TaxID=1748367 RepID=A0A917WME0_9ACTN|nr:RES family NAD+ phosphorylase [Nakamurella endophytica]GGM16271.1 hypothetical protein GCM10011594_40410 [Nakamurella endophytica]